MSKSNKRTGPTNRKSLSRKKELKTRARLFRFTEADFDQLQRLSKRYGENVSGIMDLFVRVSRDSRFRLSLDRYVAENT